MNGFAYILLSVWFAWASASFFLLASASWVDSACRLAEMKLRVEIVSYK